MQRALRATRSVRSAAHLSSLDRGVVHPEKARHRADELHHSRRNLLVLRFHSSEVRRSGLYVILRRQRPCGPLYNDDEPPSTSTNSAVVSTITCHVRSEARAPNKVSAWTCTRRHGPRRRSRASSTAGTARPSGSPGSSRRTTKRLAARRWTAWREVVARLPELGDERPIHVYVLRATLESLATQDQLPATVRRIRPGDFEAEGIGGPAGGVTTDLPTNWEHPPTEDSALMARSRNSIRRRRRSWSSETSRACLQPRWSRRSSSRRPTSALSCTQGTR